MKEHLIIYIDILGTKNAIHGQEEGRTGALIKLLSYMTSLRGDCDLKTRTEEGLIISDIRPTVSTFSDLIVISYPVETLQTVNVRSSLGQGVMLAQGYLAYLAAEAMKLGFLIRGGATVGPLHHEGGVILGPGLIDAYQLESGIAHHPRIAVSRNLVERVKFPLLPLTFLKDEDGETHLNYFIGMIMRSGEIEESRAAWLEGAHQTIRGNIARFEEAGDQYVIEKWVWFEKQLEEARRHAAPFV